jgi:hypothetical protein
MSKKVNIKDGRRFFKLGDVVSSLGPIKLDPRNIRNGRIVPDYPTDNTLDNVQFTCRENIAHNSDSKAIEKSMLGPYGAINLSEKLGTIIPISEYLSCYDNYDAIIYLYKDDLKFVKLCEEIRNAVLKGERDFSSYDNTYYVLVGGNTRYSILFMNNIKQEFENPELEIPLAVVSLEDFKKKHPGKYSNTDQ